MKDVSKAVAVTSIGITSPLGNDLDSFRGGLLESRSCLKPVSLFDTGFETAPTVAEIGGPLPVEDIPGFRLSRTDKLGIRAARDATAKLARECEDFRESGVIVATTVGGLSEIEPAIVHDPHRYYRAGWWSRVTSDRAHLAPFANSTRWAV